MRTAYFPAAGIGIVLGLAMPALANAHTPMIVNKQEYIKLKPLMMNE